MMPGGSRPSSAVPRSALAAAVLSAACAGTPPVPAPVAGPASGAGGTAYLAYVASESEDQVALVRFDGATLEVEKTITVGRFPLEIDGPHGLFVAPDGRHWYVSIAHGTPFGVLQKYATGADTLVAEVPLEMFPSSLQVDASGLFAFVANSNFHGDMVPSFVSVVYTPEMLEVARVETCTMPHGSRLSVDGRHYSTCMMDDALVEIDARTFQVTRRIPVGERPAHEHGPHQRTCSPTWAHPSPDGTRVYVACNMAGHVLEIDVADGRVARRFETPARPYNLDVTSDGRTLVVTHRAEPGRVTLWDLETGRLRADIETGRRLTHGIALTPDDAYAFVSSEGVQGESGVVDVVDLRAGRAIARAHVGKQAGGVALWRVERDGEAARADQP